MKIMVYEARPDERADLEKQAALHGVELSVTDAVPTLENASLAAGCIGVSILGQGCIDAALLDAYHALGIRYLSTRTIGYKNYITNIKVTREDIELFRNARQMSRGRQQEKDV